LSPHLTGLAAFQENFFEATKDLGWLTGGGREAKIKLGHLSALHLA